MIYDLGFEIWDLGFRSPVEKLKPTSPPAGRCEVYFATSEEKQ